MSTTIVKAESAKSFEFTAEQRKMIRDSFANGASDSEFAVLVEVARVRRLNPLLGQIHFVQRWNSARKCMAWAVQTGIDGFRAIAERTGLYDGQDEAEFLYEGKQLVCCKVRIYRKDISRPFVGVAHWSEYVQTTKDGSVTSMWANKKHIMLSKCAEAIAFRKAFPEDTSGLYVPEEMTEDAPQSSVPPPPATIPIAGEVLDTSTSVAEFQLKLSVAKTRKELESTAAEIRKLPKRDQDALRPAYAKKLNEVSNAANG